MFLDSKDITTIVLALLVALPGILGAIAALKAAASSKENGQQIGDLKTHVNGALEKAVTEGGQVAYARGLADGKSLAVNGHVVNPEKERRV